MEPTMHTENHSGCQKCLEELADCRKHGLKTCEEENEEKTAKIVELEKKIFRFAILAAVAVTLIGKELMNKIMDSFSQAESVIEKIEVPSGGKEGDTNVEVSLGDDSFLSDHFFRIGRSDSWI